MMQATRSIGNWGIATTLVLVGQLGACGAPVRSSNPNTQISAVSAESSNIPANAKSAPSLFPTVIGKDIRLAQGPIEKGKAWVAALKNLSSLELRSDPIEVQRFLDIEEVEQPRLIRPGYSHFGLSLDSVRFPSKSFVGLGLNDMSYSHIFDEPIHDLRRFSLRFHATATCITAEEVLHQFGSEPMREAPRIVVYAPKTTPGPTASGAQASDKASPLPPTERGGLLYHFLPLVDTGSISFTFDSEPCASNVTVNFKRSISK